MGYQFMAGTTGTPDYVVIHETDQIQLGLKPVFEPGTHPTMGNALYIGYRLRVNPKEGVIGIEKLAPETYPHINFDKVDKHRASAYKMVIIPLFPPDLEYSELLEVYEKINLNKELEMFLDAFYEGCPEAKYDKEELIDYTLTKFSENFKTVQADMIKVFKENGIEIPKKKKKKNNVLSLVENPDSKEK